MNILHIFCSNLRHESDDEKSSPHKKRKKKKNDKRASHEPSPPASSHTNQAKHKKYIPASKSSSKGSDLYNPESPTMDPVKETSHEGSQFLKPMFANQ